MEAGAPGSGGGSTTGGNSASAGRNSTGGASGSGAGTFAGEGGVPPDGVAGEGGAAGDGGSAGCVVGDTRSCAEVGLLGNCASGVQYCDDAGGWGECSVVPAPDSCSPGRDDDCDGIPNEGCPCTDGALEACGPETSSGSCERGSSTCVEGQWSACQGAVYPATRDCRSGDDNDCSGVPDSEDDSCQCEPGTSVECDTHPEDGTGVCKAGTLSCTVPGNGSSTRYGECRGGVAPSTELCLDDGRDENCDGTVNEAVTCEAVIGVDVAAGVSHSCVLLSDGTARCWGHNGWNELGNGNDRDSSLPVVASRVSGSNRGTSIDSSQQHTCVVTREARAFCWGADEYDQLGESFDSTDVIGVAAGWDHTCALRYGGQVRCWGSGGSGRLGQGTPWFDQSSWVGVQNVSTATQVAVGLNHSCARMADGTVRCWGENGSGQVGDGSGLSAVDTGQLVDDVEGATAVAAGGSHSCALLESGTVKCWGSNGYGQLGDGTNMNQPIATPVLGLTDVVAIDAGHANTCAILSNGSLRCWGRNSSGELGDGTNEDRKNPVEVEGLENVRAVALGGLHACAVLESGRVWCWGNNGYGELGDGTTTDSPVPVEVVLP